MKRIFRREYEAQVKKTRSKNLSNKVLHVVARNTPSAAWRVALFRRMGLPVGDGATIGLDCFLDDQFPELTQVEADVTVEPRVLTIVHDDILGGAAGPGDLFRVGQKQVSLGHVGPIRLRRGAVVGARTTLLPGVEIGEYAVVQAGAVVSRDVAAGAVVGGSPARPLAADGRPSLPTGWLPRDVYEKQVRRGRWRRAWQKVLLLAARFTLPSGLRANLYRAMGAKLGERVYVGLDTILDPDFPELITVAADAGFSIRNTFITHGVAYLPDEQGGRPRRLEYVAPIKVGARTWIGGGCVILPGVTIGEDVIIGGGAVVMDDIPDRVMAAGNPARVIKERVLP